MGRPAALVNGAGVPVIGRRLLLLWPGRKAVPLTSASRGDYQDRRWTAVVVASCFLLLADVPPELSTAPCPLFEKGKLFSYISPRTQDSSSGLFCPAGFFCFRFTAASAGSTYPSPRIQANALRTPFPCTAEGRVSRMDPMRAQVITSTNRSPPFQPFQRPRLTPDFHAESTAARKKYRKRLRLLLRNTNGNPAAAPLRKNRCVGRTDRGSVEFQRQMLPHAEPTEAERMAVKEMIRFDRLLTEVMG